MTEISVASPSEPSTQALVNFLQELTPSPLENLQLAPLAQGHHNKLFYCQGGPDFLPDRFVLRYPISRTVAATMEDDCRHRMETLKGLRTPQVLHFGRLALSGTPIALEEFVDGKARSLNELSDSEIAAFAGVVSEIHTRTSAAFSTHSGRHSNQIGTHGDYLLAMAKESVTDRLAPIDMRKYEAASWLLHRGMQTLESIANEGSDLFKGSCFSLLHHDLNQDNVLWPTTGPTLIDWNPTYGDQADDLDYIFTDNRTSTTFKQKFLAAYHPPEAAGNVIGRLSAYTLKNRLDDLAWTIEMHEEHQAHTTAAAYLERIELLTEFLDAR
jgi:hypothetical protein